MNTLKIDKDNFLKRMVSKGFELSKTHYNGCYLVEYEPFSITSTTEYLNGYCLLQAITSVVPPYSLLSQYETSNFKEKKVIDVAASPGVKTAHLARLMGNRGTIVALEKSSKRLPQLRANLSRLGVSNTIVVNFDATQVDKIPLYFDFALIDAPCTGTGLKIVKNKRTSPRRIYDVNRMAILQRKILESVWSNLAMGGIFTYSVCSLEPEEGECQIDDFISRHKNEIEVLPISIPKNFERLELKADILTNTEIVRERTIRFLPTQLSDGFYVAKIMKVGK